MGSGSLLKVLAKNFDVLAGPLVALAYPLYASVRAIETKSPVDDQQWLTYWVLYSLITLFELTFASIIEWLPFWSSMKLIFISWLVLPYFSGAAYVYQKYVRPVFVKNQMVNIWYVPQKKGIFGKSDDFLTALNKYIEENGPEALKKLTDKDGKSSKQSGKLWKGLKESKSSKESKELKASKDAKDSKPSRDSKPAKELKEQKKILKDSQEQKKALKDSKELKKSLKDWKGLKKSLKDPKEAAPLKDSNEPEQKKSSKRVTFAEVEPEKEFRASNSDWHPTSDYHSTYPEHNTWNSSFMIFDEHRYWD
ncbi:HVA22-like protein a [Lolium perenne]|uniref:HVA22-like protein a n=1 Tax=Lolium perenne TaxID=4522 RepID=UPI0021EB451D|nr:HVA22-like protein a [Lolium perenne]